MKKTIVLVLILTLLSLPAGPVAASSPEDVTIVSPMVLPPVLPPGEAPYGTFEASGPAVDAGVICPSGDVYDTGARVVTGENKKFTNLFVHKLFVCDDGSGTFEMDLVVRLIPGSTVDWRVTSGDGEYVRLRGTGKLTGQALSEGHLIDTYIGGLHID
jgi:hypothetical protein